MRSGIDWTRAAPHRGSREPTSAAAAVPRIAGGQGSPYRLWTTPVRFGILLYMGELGEVEDLVRRLLAGAPTMYLSTTADDEPWGAGAFFAESGPFDLSLVLEEHGRTLRNIRRNPRVALVVSSGNPFEPFLQGAADAELLEDDEKLTATTDALRTKAPQIEPLLAAPMVAVRLHVTRWRATDVVNGWLPGKDLLAPDAITA